MFRWGCVLVVVLSGVAAFGSSFVSVNKSHFERNNSNYYYMGANIWYAMNLGSAGPGGDRQRLMRELDRLKKEGVRNLRILGGSEGPDTEPWRVVPSLQKSPGVYDKDLLEGLDFVLSEMKKRDLTAIIMLNNFWEWSGGMAQYRRWAGAEPIPYPPASGFIEYTSKFYSDSKAMNLFARFIKMLVTRKNSITEVAYKDDPTIMAWELANEPRGAKNKKDFNKWITHTAAYIKSLDPSHLVTTGVEGDYHDSGSGLNLLENHSSPYIDYATLHVWAQNAGVYDPSHGDRTYPTALKWMKSIINHHTFLQMKLAKPLVLEEFGLAREENSYDPASGTWHRDDYYSQLFEKVYEGALSSKSTLSGVNFWAWGGEAIPVVPLGKWWQLGDPLMGDPAHEHQGWYSVFSTDTSTLSIISKYAEKLSQL